MKTKSHRLAFMLAGAFLALQLLFAESYSIVVHSRIGLQAIPLDSVSSIAFESPDSIVIQANNGKIYTTYEYDSLTYASNISDTLLLQFSEEGVTAINPRLDCITLNIDLNSCDLSVEVKGMPNLVIKATGSCSDGSITVDADSTYTLCFAGLNLTSSHAPVFSSITKQKVMIELTDENVLCDAKKYQLADSTSTANACFYSLGALTFKGDGSLIVTGNNKHAVYSKKSITFKNGTYNVPNAVSDAIHSGKDISVDGGEFHLLGMQGEGFDADDDFSMKNGNIELNITGDAAKGIKCGGIMNIEGGTINATASGSLKNKKGDLSYCSILKCDSSMVISDGGLHLINNSAGGKCISADYNITITGGEINLETHGDGAEYTNADGETDYYTSKCLAADDTLFIHRGIIQCLSTGVGGKGLVADEYMEIGILSDTIYTQGPKINVETTNSSIVNDVEEDQRYGCPKSIKASNYLNIYSGDIHSTTSGMGGEGVECGKEFYFYGGNLECNCYDDGINIGEKFVMHGGQIYCNSVDNDGIDSNGSITINGGIVAAVNQKKPNESFDSESKQLYINGGTIFGIGSSMVKIGTSSMPFYNTLFNNDPSKPIYRGLCLTSGKYIYLMKGESLIMTIKNDNCANRAFLTISCPILEESLLYGIYEGDIPINIEESYFGNKFFIGGNPQNEVSVIDFYPTKEVE